MGERSRAEPLSNIDNRLKSLRTAKGLSQAELASMAGITRQAVYAIEANQYLPTTAVALRLASALASRVEDLFSLRPSGEIIEGAWIGTAPAGKRGKLTGQYSEHARVRVKVAMVGERTVVRPVADLGDVLNFTIAADGLVIGPAAGPHQKGRIRVELWRDRHVVERGVVVAGCDPAIFLVGEYLHRRDRRASVVGWTMGSAAALEALKRQEVHMAGLHLVDDKSGESNLPYLRRHLRGAGFVVVTFASWEQGLMTAPGNPKGIRGIEDLPRKDLRLINRESGAGARVLLDRRLASLGIKPGQLTGYGRMADSHLSLARLIAEGQGDAGVGVRAAANLMGLGFIPLQTERYDLVFPRAYLESPAVAQFMDTLVSRPLRTEIAALGGYDTRETGQIRELAHK